MIAKAMTKKAGRMSLYIPILDRPSFTSSMLNSCYKTWYDLSLPKVFPKDSGRSWGHIEVWASKEQI